MVCLFKVMIPSEFHLILFLTRIIKTAQFWGYEMSHVVNDSSCFSFKYGNDQVIKLRGHIGHSRFPCLFIKREVFTFNSILHRYSALTTQDKNFMVKIIWKIFLARFQLINLFF